MRKTLPLIISLCVILLCGTAISISAKTLNGVEILSGQWRGQQIEYLDREILLMLEPNKSQSEFEATIENYPVEIVREADRWGFMKLQAQDRSGFFELIEEIDQMGIVRYAEPNMVDEMYVIPNDSLFDTQWHYHNTGQSPPGGTPDADIDAPEGWDISTGSDTIIVGVLDSGIPMQSGSLSHPDLDDPARFIIGQDVINLDMEPLDDNGHGTHVSGTIGAETNNGIGVAGVAWNVKIMAIKVFTSSGSGSHEYFRDGCIYGVDNGCKVLNYSGGGSAGATKEHGVAYADSNDVVLCAAAGNNNQGSVSWPGAYSVDYDNVICVSSTTPDDGSSSFSSIGPEVTVSAPGGTGSPFDEDDIQSTFPNYPCYLTTNYGLPQSYGPLAGTSMATPHVAGFAGLILSMNPTLTPDSVRQIMINTSDDLGPAGFDNQFGYGRINVFNALSQMGSVIITHTPLPDTRDSLNDYEVSAVIWAMNDLVPESLLLYYELNSTWYEETMVATGTEDEYHAFIPAQQPGTTINYYIYAQNIDGEADTTDTYTFSVLDYDIILEPSLHTIYAPAYDTVWSEMYIINNGAYEDQYSLTIAGNSWSTSIWDEPRINQISQTPLMLTGDSLPFYVRVLVPSTLEGEYDSVDIVAESFEQPGYTESAILKTISTGEPWEIPFTDIFATSTFDDTKWESWDGAELNNIGIDEPSSPYSANLNGDPDGGDQLITEMINLKDQTNVVVEYFYQQTGDGESPDADDDLIIEYLDTDSSWIELNRHLGSEPDMTEFEEVEIQLPQDALHAGFRLSIRCTATSGSYDDWFVDDIYVGHPSDYDVAVGPSFQSEYGPSGDSAVYTLTVINEGFLQDDFDLSYSGGWNTNFFDASGSTQISSTGPVNGADSIDILVKVEVPPGAPLHTDNSTTVTVTSQGDNNISAYAMIETVSAGTPALIPWYETFPDDSLYTQRWFTYVGDLMRSSAPGTPSWPYSINLDGGKDTIATQLIDISAYDDVLLSYYYEMGGDEDVPEPGDNLWIEYRNSAGVWTNLMIHDGGGEAMNDFEFVNIP
ncbi:MAG: S8 family serine peptidase, partial [candidate division Zixibacteria bacterium]|nr:S8 family serine peptidase [candidate division Zixibacteria bacterium]